MPDAPVPLTLVAAAGERRSADVRCASTWREARCSLSSAVPATRASGGPRSGNSPGVANRHARDPRPARVVTVRSQRGRAPAPRRGYRHRDLHPAGPGTSARAVRVGLRAARPTDRRSVLPVPLLGVLALASASARAIARGLRLHPAALLTAAGAVAAVTAAVVVTAVVPQQQGRAAADIRRPARSPRPHQHPPPGSPEAGRPAAHSPPRGATAPPGRRHRSYRSQTTPSRRPPGLPRHRVSRSPAPAQRSRRPRRPHSRVRRRPRAAAEASAWTCWASGSASRPPGNRLPARP